MKTSLEAYHKQKKENFARGLELLVHFQIGLRFRVKGYGLSTFSLMWLLLVGSLGSVLLESWG